MESRKFLFDFAWAFLALFALASCASSRLKSFYDGEKEAEGKLYRNCLVSLDKTEARIRRENEGFIVLDPSYARKVTECSLVPKPAAQKCLSAIDLYWESSLMRKYDEEATERELARLYSQPERMKQAELLGPGVQRALHLNDLFYATAFKYLVIEAYVKQLSEGGLEMVMGERRAKAASMHSQNGAEIEAARALGRRVEGLWRGRVYGSLCGNPG